MQGLPVPGCSQRTCVPGHGQEQGRVHHQGGAQARQEEAHDEGSRRGKQRLNLFTDSKMVQGWAETGNKH